MLSVGATGVLGVLAIFRDYILRLLAVFQGSVLRILPELPSITGFGTAGTACTWRPVLLTILPVLAVFGPLVLLILPVFAVFRPPVLQNSRYSEYEVYSILPSMLGV